MRLVWRTGVGAPIFCLILTFGELTGPLLLAVLADIVVAVLLVRTLGEAYRRGQKATGGDDRLVLLRRTVPHLRQRRPVGVIEMQIRWRARAETAAARRGGLL